jgi:cell division protein FtsW (lipid II flippase)
VQGQYAFGSGGLVGSGLGLGHPGLIPVATSDFIFAAIGEETGLLGTVGIVMAFLLLVGASLRTALVAKSEFAKLLAAGIAAAIGFQAFFIMAGVVRLLPLTGVTLPFVAYGGSSLLANYVLIALLVRVSDENVQQAVPPNAERVAVAAG